MKNNLTAILIGDIITNKTITYRSLCALATADAVIKQYNSVFDIKPYFKRWFGYYPNIEVPKELTHWCSSTIPHMFINDKNAIEVFNICGAVVGLFANSKTEARVLALNVCPGAKVSIAGDVLAISEAMYLMHNSYEYSTLHSQIIVDYFPNKDINSKVYRALKIALNCNTIEDILDYTQDLNIIPLITGLLYTNIEDIPDDAFNDCFEYFTDSMKKTILDFETISNGRQQD